MAGHEMKHQELINELVEVLERTRDVIHGFVCIVGDKGGDYRCWKECNDACAVLEKAKLIDDCIPSEEAYEAAMDHGH